MVETIVFSGMDVGVVTTCLKYVGVMGLSNCRKQVMIQALSQRLLQLRISLDTVRRHANLLLDLKEKVSVVREEAEEADASPEKKAECARLDAEEKTMAGSVHEKAANCRVTGTQVAEPGEV